MYRYRRDDVHQEEDAPPRARVAGALALAVVITLALIGWAWGTTSSEMRALRPSGRFPVKELGPLHEVAGVLEGPYTDLGPGQALRAKARAELERYRWVDRDGGIVAVPVGVAMGWIAEESAADAGGGGR